MVYSIEKRADFGSAEEQSSALHLPSSYRPSLEICTSIGRKPTTFFKTTQALLVIRMRLERSEQLRGAGRRPCPPRDLRRLATITLDPKSNGEHAGGIANGHIAGSMCTLPGTGGRGMRSAMPSSELPKSSPFSMLYNTFYRFWRNSAGPGTWTVAEPILSAIRHLRRQSNARGTR